MTGMPPTIDWFTANQRLLGAELACLRHRLLDPSGPEAVLPAELATACAEARKDMPSPAAIDVISDRFDLSDFERGLLLLCCGVELDAAIGDACATAHGHPSKRNATFAIAMSRLPSAHWSALTPVRPLRRWRLLDVEAGPRLVDVPLRVDERVLHFVAGINLVDARIRPLLTLHSAPDLMPGSHGTLVERICIHLSNERTAGDPVHLTGNDGPGQQDVFAAVATTHGCHAYSVHADDLPSSAVELEQLQALWEREARLLPAMLLVRSADELPGKATTRFLQGLQAPTFVVSRKMLQLQRPIRTWTVDKPETLEQRELWHAALGEQAGPLNGSLDALAGQFRLSTRDIIGFSLGVDEGDPGAARQLWHSCRQLGHERLEDLAERLVPAADWDDLVLPAAQQAMLRQIAAHLRQRVRVFEDWGFSGQGRRGMGVSALFCGESGTGKTMAAEVLARTLDLDIYRIDLSAVVSKYIGETEKNLRRVFDAAEDSGSILLFDEADALFGKRSEVKDSHDRYANIEVSYLLQRMEAYRGLAILTSNMKSAMDRAFHRRLRFIVNFPFPDSVQREQIWRRAFPGKVPLDGLDYALLARLNLPGGNIRNIALNAAFLAAEADGPVTMAHLLRAAKSEGSKIDRPLADAETRGWA
jgi:hypothetical protein